MKRFNTEIQKEKVFGLVRCKNDNCRQERIQNKEKYIGSIYNRDTNAVLNMQKIMRELIKTGKRPKEYTRENQ